VGFRDDSGALAERVEVLERDLAHLRARKLELARALEDRAATLRQAGDAEAPTGAQRRLETLAADGRARGRRARIMAALDCSPLRLGMACSRTWAPLLDLVIIVAALLPLLLAGQLSWSVAAAAALVALRWAVGLTIARRALARELDWLASLPFLVRGYGRLVEPRGRAEAVSLTIEHVVKSDGDELSVALAAAPQDGWSHGSTAALTTANLRHLRVRFRRLVDEVLLPLHRARAIDHVEVR